MSEIVKKLISDVTVKQFTLRDSRGQHDSKRN